MVLTDAVEEILKDQPYDHSKIGQFINDICERCTKTLVRVLKKCILCLHALCAPDLEGEHRESVQVSSHVCVCVCVCVQVEKGKPFKYVVTCIIMQRNGECQNSSTSRKKNILLVTQRESACRRRTAHCQQLLLGQRK